MMVAARTVGPNRMAIVSGPFRSTGLVSEFIGAKKQLTLVFGTHAPCLSLNR
jgi:hypothetical protein